MHPARSRLALLVALVAVVALPVVGSVVAMAPTIDAARAPPVDAATTPQAQVESPSAALADSAQENLSATIELPKTVAANVTLNYSVAVSGADGNVSANWTFVGVRTGHRNGTDVQYAFADGGNATISVLVTDESGASVTTERTVAVVEYGSEDDDPAGSTPFRFLGAVAIIVLVLVGFPAVMYVFVLPKVMAYLTDEF